MAGTGELHAHPFLFWKRKSALGTHWIVGHALAQMVEVLRYKPEGCGFYSRLCHWNLSLTYFRTYYGTGVDSASNRNDYQEYFLRFKWPVRRADSLTAFM